MRAFKVPPFLPQVVVLLLAFTASRGVAADKPTGAPLQLSAIETEQAVLLAYVDPNGKTGRWASVKIHWAKVQHMGANDEAASFSIHLTSDNPNAPTFT